MSDQWNEEEVFQMSPETELHKIENIGPVKLEIFSKAGLVRAGDILHGDFLERRIQTAINELKLEQPGMEDKIWSTRGALCMSVVDRFRLSDACPIHPDYLVCPLSGELFKDPVITPLGHTYDRCELERAFMCGFNFEPQAPSITLSIEEVIPNRAIEEAVTFYRRHMMRFNVLLKR